MTLTTSKEDNWEFKLKSQNHTYIFKMLNLHSSKFQIDKLNILKNKIINEDIFLFF